MPQRFDSYRIRIEDSSRVSCISINPELILHREIVAGIGGWVYNHEGYTIASNANDQLNKDPYALARIAADVLLENGIQPVIISPVFSETT